MFKGIWIFFTSIIQIITGTLFVLTCILKGIADFFDLIAKDIKESQDEDRKDK